MQNNIEICKDDTLVLFFEIKFTCIFNGFSNQLLRMNMRLHWKNNYHYQFVHIFPQLFDNELRVHKTCIQKKMQKITEILFYWRSLDCSTLFINLVHKNWSTTNLMVIFLYCWLMFLLVNTHYTFFNTHANLV